MRNSGAVVIALSLLLVASLLAWQDHADELIFHTKAELDTFNRMMSGTDSLSIAESGVFFTAGNCVGCHGFDSLGMANVNNAGEDVNVVDAWRASMMANSARDPYWRAKVSHEILVNPDLQTEIEDLCTSCHAPMGHYNAKLYGGAAHYGFDDMLGDALGLDGVSCGACHQQSPIDIGNGLNGDLDFDTSGAVYGPYGAVFEPPMTTFLGLEPQLGTHVSRSESCASCHTLITSTVDLAGNPTGGTFVEQATYHEWQNSRYEAENVECQTCHVPRIFDDVVISNNYLFLDPQTPYGLHELVGGNTYMLELMKKHRDTLDIPANDVHYDSTIARTFRMLESAGNVSASFKGNTYDTASFAVHVINHSGHKFPSGFPSRRLFIEFEMIDSVGNSFFHSGALDANFEFSTPADQYEPHYEVVRDPSQTQIYQMVLGDVNGDLTTVLERGAMALKDNRLVPEGFSKTHLVYDTTQIAGEALTDPDFNIGPMGEGSGADSVFYQVALDGYSGPASVQVSLWYQTLPPTWLEEMFGFSGDSDFISDFKSMYEGVDPEPVLIAQTAFNLDIDKLDPPPSGFSAALPAFDIYPTLSLDGNVFIKTDKPYDRGELVDLQGRVLSQFENLSQLQLPEPGVYFVRLWWADRSVVEKVVRY